jgi:hypothetical protein
MSLTKKEEAVIAAYRQAEQILSTPERRVRFLGHAQSARPCPQCKQVMPQAGWVINLGHIEGRWRWVCLQCAPSNPQATPHAQQLQEGGFGGLVKAPRRARPNRPYTQRFIPREEATSWDPDGVEAVHCPVCGDSYTHPGEPERIKGRDNYEAWEGRGDLVTVTFWCESGHTFSLNFGFHKGSTICFWEYVAQLYWCKECREEFEGKPGDPEAHLRCANCERRRQSRDGEGKHAKAF